MDEERPNTDPPPEEADDAGLTEDLVAYLDGELSMEGNEAVQAKIGLDPTVRAEADALKKTWDLLDYLPRSEPSPNFTERTLSRLEPVLPAGTSSSSSGPSPARSGPTPGMPQPSTATMPVVPPRTLRQKLLLVGASFLLFAGAALAGYFVRAQVVMIEQHELDARILSEQRLLKNVQRFRYVDDIEFLKELDNPELFGDEPFVSTGEGPQ